MEGEGREGREGEVGGRKEWGGKGEYASLALGGWTPLTIEYEISDLPIFCERIIAIF